MRIGFVLWSLGMVRGGVERLGVNIAHAMQERGHSPVIFYQGQHSDLKPCYPVNAEIPLVNLALSGLPASVFKAREKIQACGLDVLCAMFSWADLLWFPALLNGSGIPLLISEHNHPRIIEKERWNEYERTACMAAADHIHVLNSAFKDMFPAFLQDRISVVPNPAQPPCPACGTDARRAAAPRKKLLGMGRLVEEHKQFSLLIEAFALLAAQFADWDLHICGEGKDRPFYESLISRYDLQNRAFLHGDVEDVDEFYATSHLFCIPSRYEGFGLVTVEAMRHHLPAVGFAGCSATNEIIIHGENGILAPEMNAKALAASLRPLMSSESMRHKLGGRAAELLTRYAPEAIYDQWEAMLRHTAAHKNKTRLMYSDFSEEKRAETHLREILVRPHPFLSLNHNALHEKSRLLEQAYNLLKQHGIIN